MTDNDVIKALECLTGTPLKCRECPYSPRYRFPLCQQQVAKDAVSLINQLQKNQNDIDKFARTLSYGRKFKGKFINDFEDVLDFIAKEKAEAIKEFAERLKSVSGSVVATQDGRELYETKTYSISAMKLDNLVKEMVGE